MLHRDEGHLLCTDHGDEKRILPKVINFLTLQRK